MERWMVLLAVLLFAGPAQARGVRIQHKSSALEFSYSWPNEAAAIPALQRRFRSDMAKAYREALANARDDQKLYRQEQRVGMSDYYSLAWTSAGETARLLSLESELGTFTGGAHPNTSYDALIWDRRLGKTVSMGSLFVRASDFEALTRAAYCRALLKERLKRREGMKLGGDFDQCPKYSDLAIAPLDRDRNGRFEKIAFIASPYVAGPYVEGEYEIVLPVTRKLVAALRADYASAFEAQ